MFRYAGRCAAMLNARAESRSSIQVIWRAASVLEVLAKSSGPQSLAEICRAVNLNKSTAFNILGTLVEIGYVSIAHDTRRYRLGPGVLSLGIAFQAGHEIRAVAYPHMSQLRNTTGETVTLHTRYGWHRTCIDQVPSLQPIRRVVEIGRQRDLYVGAVGLVFLAGLNDSEVIEYLAQAELIPVTSKTVTDPNQIRDRVADVRISGYAFVVEEGEIEVSAVAVPIQRGNDHADYGLVVSGPANRWTDAAMHSALPAIHSCAEQIRSDMGWLTASSSDVARTSVGSIGFQSSRPVHRKDNRSRLVLRMGGP
jgi:DNA-binding IclR family transcriptional regulator